MVNKKELTTEEYCEKIFLEAKKEAKLYPCEPVDWLWMPKPVRDVVAIVTMTMFASFFLVAPVLPIFLIPEVWRTAPVCSTIFVGSVVLSMALPQREWIWARKLGQLWYEPLQFSCNVPPEYRTKITSVMEKHKLVMAMHPHGIVPFHALLWAAFCDQYYEHDGKKLYGFGAAADVVQYLPFLRNLLGWLSSGSAEYKVLKAGLEKGICRPVQNSGRASCAPNLYILPGGIAEVFQSTPNKHAIVFKERRGLCKLALETGAELCPSYVFGATDFFENLATSDSSIFARFSRRFRMGVTIFWGRFGTPVPFTPRLTLCIPLPIKVSKWDVATKGPVPGEVIDELHKRYLDCIVDTFETYKAAAGYPDAQLEIL